MIETQYLPTARTEMLAFITNQPKKSLEVGCREAFFSGELRKRFSGIETWGIEPDERVDVSLSNQNLDIFIRDFFPSSDEKFVNQKFDLIVFNDVLEHMYDPWKSLKQCQEMLSPDGIIVASLPNVRHKSVLKQLIFQDNFEYQTSGVLDISHIRFFTLRTMQKMFVEAGFEIIKIEPLKSEQKLYKKILKSYKELFHILTGQRFSSIRYAQYGITARIAK